MPHDHHALTREMTTGEAVSEAPTDTSISPINAGGPMAAVWDAMTAVIATLMGLAPHVLHHIGLFAGAAFVVGVGGNLLFGAVGLLLSIPLLRRLHRRFGTWKAPGVAIAVFTVMFSISAFVIGPAISGNEPAEAPQPAGTPSRAEHSAHHTD
ncbi:MAG TPA: hypothetical protein VFR87_07105 [Nocardioidaceae bacterium]|nr:hypothetical protein [Nocardioidaceae bacterium]